MSIPENLQNSSLDAKWRSFAHLMAAAIKQIFPKVQFGLSQVTEDGCYCEAKITDENGQERILGPEDLTKIEEKIRSLLEDGVDFEKQEVSLEEAIEIFSKNGQLLKVELLENLGDNGMVGLEEEKADLETDSDSWETDYYNFVLSKILSPINFENIDTKSGIYMYLACYTDFGNYADPEIIEYQKTINEENGKFPEFKNLFVTTKNINNDFIHTTEEYFDRIININTFPGYFYTAFSGSWPTDKDAKEIIELIKNGNINLEFSGVQHPYRDQKFKLKVVKNDLPAITLYRLKDQKSGEVIFEDLCSGPHVKELKEFSSLGFSLSKLSDSYWCGDEQRGICMQRIQALFFETETLAPTI